MRCFFPDPRHIRLQTPEAGGSSTSSSASTLEGSSTRNHGHAGGHRRFVSGEGGIYPDRHLDDRPVRAGGRHAGAAALHSYAVYPYPRLWGEQRRICQRPWLGRARSASARPSSARPSPASSASWPTIISTGRGPAICPHSRRSSRAPPSARCRIAPTSPRWPRSAGRCPAYVRRQNAIEGLVGEEVASRAVTSLMYSGR